MQPREPNLTERMLKQIIGITGDGDQGLIAIAGLSGVCPEPWPLSTLSSEAGSLTSPQAGGRAVRQQAHAENAGARFSSRSSTNTAAFSALSAFAARGQHIIHLHQSGYVGPRLAAVAPAGLRSRPRSSRSGACTFPGRRASKPLAGVFIDVHGVCFRMLYVHTVIGRIRFGSGVRRQDAGDGLLPQNATVWTNVYWVQKSRKSGCCMMAFSGPRP